ncbi:MAG TPA: dTDP-4-dehydrorhamnose reductase [Burkholderiales bacterium]|nr:dTDP-4-dehydrorhamnose reductase [Burkholderiales bacterium]
MAARDILLTGGAGQVGTELIARAPHDWRIVAPSSAELDITDRARVAEALASRRWALVINAAAYTAVDRAEDDAAAAWAVNATGAANLAAAAAAHAVPLIQLSTDYVFDGTKPAPYLEDDPVAPLGVYGASKEAGEQAVRAAQSRHVILRTAWVVSPHRVNFLKTMFRLADEGRALRVVDDQLGSPTSAADIAGAVIAVGRRLIEDPAAPTGTYHFASAGEATWRELAAFALGARAAHGAAAPRVEAIATSDYPTRAKRPMNSRLATGKIARDFGIRPRPWREAIAEVVEALAEAATR